MANKQWLIDVNAIPESATTLSLDGRLYVAWSEIIKAPTVVAYTEEQMEDILQFAEALTVKNKELEKERDWLKSCLNCKIRKECPRHCGKVVHGCDHWEYGDSTVDAVEVVHGRWVDNGIPESMLSGCSVCGFTCGAYSFNYCPNCGAKMDGGIN